MNVSVDKNRSSALIRYVSQEGPMAAKNSSEMILNCPEIKLSYEPPTPTSGPIPEKRPSTPVMEPMKASVSGG